MKKISVILTTVILILTMSNCNPNRNKELQKKLENSQGQIDSLENELKVSKELLEKTKNEADALMQRYLELKQKCK